MIENSPGNRFQESLFYSNRSNLATKMKPGHNTVKLKKAVVLFRYLNFQKKNSEYRLYVLFASSSETILRKLIQSKWNSRLIEA